MTPHLNCLIETVQMRGHNICFYVELTKIIPNYHQILCSAYPFLIKINVFTFRGSTFYVPFSMGVYSCSGKSFPVREDLFQKRFHYPETQTEKKVTEAVHICTSGRKSLICTCIYCVHKLIFTIDKPNVSSPVKSTESYCCHFDVGVGIGVTLKKFYIKIFLCYGQGTVRRAILCRGRFYFSVVSMHTSQC